MITTADTDFGTLLAATRKAKPSVILVRELLPLPSSDQARLITENLPNISDDLAHGAVVVFSKQKIRVRCLPIE